MFQQKGSGREEGSQDTLQPRSIDAFWLQRELGKYYTEAEASRTKSDEVLEILRNASDERELENKLMLLLGHDKFALIRLLRKNRMVVLYCTLLASAQSAKDKKDIEDKMEADPDLAPILHALTENIEEDLIQVCVKVEGMSTNSEDTCFHPGLRTLLNDFTMGKEAQQQVHRSDGLYSHSTFAYPALAKMKVPRAVEWFKG